MYFQETIRLSEARPGEMHDLTPEVQEIVSRSGIKFGLVHVFNIGSTASIGTIEFEPGLLEDLPNSLNKLLPPDKEYGHERTWHDGNGHSHLQATLLGPGITVPLQAGRLLLGRWQQIFHLECDTKQRTREIIVTLQGE